MHELRSRSVSIGYLILTNFRAYLISRNRQIRISRGFIFAISDKKGLKGFKMLWKYRLYFRVFRYIAKTANIILILAKISENKVVAWTHVTTYCILSGFVLGQGQKSEQQDITKNFAALHNHLVLLTMNKPLRQDETKYNFAIGFFIKACAGKLDEPEVKMARC